MPAEPTNAQAKRRAQRDDNKLDGSYAREIESKRNRGEVSCAECRRLKIKCDKQIPCHSCQRRGCAALCPNGSLATGQGTRFVLAATEHLHEQLSKHTKRIRLLEDALSVMQSKVSTEPHPLLLDDPNSPLTDGGDWRSEESETTSIHGNDIRSPTLDAFGTLSISDKGVSRFFGRTGGSESLLNEPGFSLGPSRQYDQPSEPGPSFSRRTPEVQVFSRTFPFAYAGAAEDAQEMIKSRLPPYDHASTLAETYFRDISWLLRGVTRAQIVEDMLPVIYKHSPASPSEDYFGPHDLALIFIVFAISALIMENMASEQADHFYQLSKAALCLQPVLEKPSLVTIQTLHLMSFFNAIGGNDLQSETSMEVTWNLVTLAAHLSQSIGLHRDSTRWGFSPKLVQRRRVVFWDLFVADVWQSLSTGRPPSFSLPYIDTAFPENGNGTEFKIGDEFEKWNFKFAAEVVAEVAAKTLTAEMPSYSTIMELDTKVREFSLPERIRNPEELDVAESMQRCVMEHIRECVLLYIHRSFFAQAIIDQPVNPLKSVYAPSFLASYRSSCTILKSIRNQFDMFPNMCSRFWQMWSFGFSAALVFGTVVTRGPRSPLALDAMAELDKACLLFSKAALQSRRAAKALVILAKLSEKARYALAEARGENDNASVDNGIFWTLKTEGKNAVEDDELDIFAGRTRAVVTPTSSFRNSPVPELSLTPQSRQLHQRHSASPPVTLGVVNYTQKSPTSVSPVSSSSPLLLSIGSGSFGPYSRTTSISPQPLNLQPVPPQNHPQILPSDTPTYLSSQTQPGLGDYFGSEFMSSQPRMDYTASSQPHTSESSNAALHRYNEYFLQQSPHALHSTSPRHQRPVTDLDWENRSLPDHFAQQQQEYLNPLYQTQPQHDDVPRNISERPDPSFFSAEYGPPVGSGVRPGDGHASQLADLGLAARDSRLDARWTLFMEESGLLEGVAQRTD